MKVSFFSPINQKNDMRSAAEGDNPISASPNAQWPVPPAFYDKKRGHEGFRQRDRRSAGGRGPGLRLDELLGAPLRLRWPHADDDRPGRCNGRATKKIKIAIMGPVLAINNPVRTAEEIAIVDNISDGRVVVGLLRGTPNEFNVYSVNPAETRERAAECMALLLKCWQEPVPFSWEGRHFRFRTVAVWPQPYQDPIPPTYVLGYHHESIETAAKNHLGMGISFHLPDVFLPAVEHYRARCAYYGWEPGPEQIIYRGRLHIAESDQQADEEIDSMFTRGRMGNRPGANSVSKAIWAG